MIEPIELRGRIEHLGLELIETAQAVRHVARDGVDGARLGEGAAVHGADHLQRLGVARLALGKVAVARAQQVVGLAELMDQPDHLVGMFDQIGREARRDDEIDPLARRLGEAHQSPGEAPLQQLGPRGPVERQGDDVHLEAAGLELVAQGVDQHLGSAVGERDLGGADDDARLHPPARSFSSRRRSRVSTRAESWRSSRAARSCDSTRSSISRAAAWLKPFCCSSTGRMSHLRNSL